MSFDCESCGRPTRYENASVLATRKDGLESPAKDNARWLVACAECSTPYVYWIDVSRIARWERTSPGDDSVHGWIEHLNEKDWFNRHDFLAAARRAYEYRDRQAVEDAQVPSEIVDQIDRTLHAAWLRGGRPWTGDVWGLRADLVRLIERYLGTGAG